MTGLELFYEELKKRDYNMSDPDVSRGDKNGNVEIYCKGGKSTVQNLKKIAELYGTLTFYHYEPKEAMDQIFELIQLQMNSSNLNE